MPLRSAADGADGADEVVAGAGATVAGAAGVGALHAANSAAVNMLLIVKNGLRTVIITRRKDMDCVCCANRHA